MAWMRIGVDYPLQPHGYWQSAVQARSLKSIPAHTQLRSTASAGSAATSKPPCLAWRGPAHARWTSPAGPGWHRVMQTTRPDPLEPLARYQGRGDCTGTDGQHRRLAVLICRHIDGQASSQAPAPPQRWPTSAHRTNAGPYLAMARSDLPATRHATTQGSVVPAGLARRTTTQAAVRPVIAGHCSQSADQGCTC